MAVRLAAAFGANVVGLSIDIPTEPSHFAVEYRGDHDSVTMFAMLTWSARRWRVQPDFAFHLAAQPLVRRLQSAETFSVNASERRLC